MSMSNTARKYIEDQSIDYHLLHHEQTHCSQETAQVMHIKGDKLAKSVVLEDEQGYVMAVIPSTHRLNTNALNSITHRNLVMTNESELNELFHDCQIGAIPPIGSAYGLETVVDKTLLDQEDIYFEAGDHENVVHLKGDSFERLIADAKKAIISEHR